MAQTARVGLKNIHVAVMNSDGTYGVPTKIAGAMTATITPNTSRAILYTDNKAVETAQALGVTEVSFGVASLSPDEYAMLLGKSVNADGAIVENSDDKPPYVAFGFESEKSDGTIEYNWFYKGDFAVPEATYNTKGESVEFQNQTITGQFVARENGDWRARVDSGNPSANQTVIDSWFDAVYEAA